MKISNLFFSGRHRFVAIALLAQLLFWAAPRLHAQASHGISAGNLNVVQNDGENTTNSVTVTLTLSVNDFRLRDGSNRGDYNVQAGLGFSDDVDSGVMLASVSENGRDNADTNSPGINYCTSTVDYTRTGVSAGAYYISSFNAPTGSEYNINVAAAFFPYSSWLGGLARNSGATNGGVNDLLTASPGIVLGTNFIDNGGGLSTLNLTNLGIDSRTNAILLVCGGKNEDNYALSMVNSNNGTWTIFIKDNGTDTSATEQDPVAFVVIPKTNNSVIAGRFNGSGTALMYNGASPKFTATNIATGIWRLTIPGQSPQTGVLILSAEGGLSQNQDNIVSYQPDGSTWLIQSRDLPPDPPSLQTPSGDQPVASFVFVPSAVNITLVAPPDNSQAQPSNPTLQVSVTNAAAGNLTVSFYGHVGAANPATDFTVVALPDTQFYVSSLNGGVPGMFYAQTEWIITNRISRNIAYVAQLGDLSQSGDIVGGNPNTTEWRNATNAMYRLEDPLRTLLAYGIPYGVAVGNHDEEPIGDSTGTTTFYNQYFGISHFAGRPYYAGHYGANNNNHFDFFSAGGMDFIVLYFQYDETLNPAWLQWGNDVLRTNQNRRAIIVTHNFGNTTTPVNFSPQGQAIYNTLKTNKNVFLMLAGHVTGEGSRVDTYQGNTVRTFVSDYQGWAGGGNGYLRIITFSPTNNQVVLQTYSPWLNDYTNGPTSDIWFTYNMQQSLGSNGVPYSLIGTVSNVPPGGVASLPWPGRAYGTGYEWYVVVTDATGNTTTGPAWRFATAANFGPTTTNQAITVYGDASTNLTLYASDVNGDPLTFYTNNVPLHGVVRSVNPAGIATYSPIRGYRGFDRFAFYATDGYATSSIVTIGITVVAPPDTNANGLPDGWEATYGINSASADADGDGHTNLEEYYANTNPTNAASIFRILSAVPDNAGHVTLKWPSIGGTRYRLQYCDGAPGGGITGNFIDIVRALNVEMDTGPYGSVSTQTFVDNFTLTPVPANRCRYYRIKITQ